MMGEVHTGFGVDAYGRPQHAMRSRGQQVATVFGWLALVPSALGVVASVVGAIVLAASSCSPEAKECYGPMLGWVAFVGALVLLIPVLFGILLIRYGRPRPAAEHAYGWDASSSGFPAS